MLVVGDSVDTFHSWDAGNPAWTETIWFGAWIPEAAISVYVYQWFRPVLGIYGGGCLVWDAKAYLPWDIPVFRYDVNRPLPAQVDLRRLQLDCGTSITCLREGEVYDIAYRRGDVDLAMRFTAVTPPDIVTAKGVAEFFNGHIDQAGRYTGHLTLAGRRHAIDCFGIRDRSWGPRVIGDDIRMNYCHGQSEHLAFLCYSKPEGDTDTVFKGYLARDGQRRELVGGQRRAHYRDGQLARIDVALEDSDGRTLAGSGVPLNRFVYEPYPGLVNWLQLMEWRFGDEVIYGEEQDVWSIALWHQREPGKRA